MDITYQKKWEENVMCDSEAEKILFILNKHERAYRCQYPVELEIISNFIDKQQLTNSDTPKKSTVPNEDKKGIR